MSELEIKFRGSFAQKMNAIQVGPDNTRLTIDVPATEQGNAIGLQLLLSEPLIFIVRRDNSPSSTRIERPEDTTIADEKPKPKAKKVSGPYRYFWEVLHDNGLQNNMAILEELDCTPDQVWGRLHVEFEVETMSVVSPPQFTEWVKKKGLPEGLITMANNAQPVALRKEDEARRKAGS